MKNQAMFQACPKCGRMKNSRSKTCALCAGKGHKDKPADSVVLKCKNCKDDFQIPRWRFNQGRGLFCSKKCKDEFLKTIRGIAHVKYTGRFAPTTYKGTNWKEARQAAFNRAKGKCEWCHKDLSEVKRFATHHIISAHKFKSEDDAHGVDNLAVICQSCHAKYHNLGKTPKKA
jgi:hypothetical protein